MTKFVFDIFEIILGEGENAGLLSWCICIRQIKTEAKMTKFVFDILEIILGKGENAGLLSWY